MDISWLLFGASEHPKEETIRKGSWTTEAQQAPLSHGQGLPIQEWQLFMVAHTCDPRTREAEAEGLQVPGQPVARGSFKSKQVNNRITG